MPGRQKSKSRGPATLFVWRKLASARWEDAWVERLHFAGPDRVAIVRLAGAKTIRIEAYVSRRDAAGLVAKFGGEIRPLKSWIFTNEWKRAPLKIRDRLLVAPDAASRAKVRREFPNRAVVVIPAGMAFGTGEHATTATCLRLLVDISTDLQAGWAQLDLGTGTGILAIAGAKLGASRVDAMDFDPDAVRVARENAIVNAVEGIRFRRADVTRWQPARQWEVVTANLYSDLQVRCAGTIAAAVAPGGRLILSGILRNAEQEVAGAVRATGIKIETVRRQGKWVTIMGCKPVRKKR